MRFSAHRLRSFILSLIQILTTLLLPYTLSAQTNPDAICRTCHQQIYDRYQQTRMAHASGNAVDGLITGSFFHRPSGIDYHLLLRNNQAWLTYDRTATPAASKDTEPLHGEKQLLYFIGSGNRGRTYLFQQDGFWFESPVNWYGKKQLWDMNPKSLNAKEMPFTLPVDATCLHCHTSAAAASLPGSRNHFQNAPFAHSGITCESCHGDTSAHVAQSGHGPLLKLSTLAPTRRDSVCLQCHLEGETAVNQPNHSLTDFHPGDDLSDDVRFFTHAGEIGSNGRATSQWEALLQSACFRKSNGRMSCTSCHDPHSDPSPEDRVAFFRNKCIACHNSPTFIAAHHPDQPSCASCHMARLKSEDIAHEQVTDHFIQKYPATNLPPASTLGQDLVPVGNQSSSERDLGLAYAQAVIKGDAQDIEKAKDLLQRAEKQEQPTDRDADLHTNLGFLDLLSNEPSAAAREYQAALSIDPRNSSAAADLAVIDARAHKLSAALPLWRSVAENDPGHIGAGYNLALGECMSGNAPAAIDALHRIIAFSPDDAKARTLLLQLQQHPDTCSNFAHQSHN
jgi:Cytochrome c554 and c-prime